MYPPEFNYARAGTVTEALSLLSQHQGAKLLAGGHSLIPILKLRQARPEMLIDIGRIPDLQGIQSSNGSLRIGALTTHATLAASQEIPAALSEAAGMVADLQVRNRGTVGGNVSHADPASDLPTVFSALEATFLISGQNGERTIPAGDFFRGLFETALEENEILTAVVVPSHKKGTGSAYAKMKNPASGYAMLGAAAVLSVADGKCTAASVALGGLTPKPTRIASIESALVGNALSKDAIAHACNVDFEYLGVDLLGDIHASAEYRKAMAPVYLKRALEAAAQRAVS